LVARSLAPAQHGLDELFGDELPEILGALANADVSHRELVL
jgi:hypothetical protein